MAGGILALGIGQFRTSCIGIDGELAGCYIHKYESQYERKPSQPQYINHKWGATNV